MSIEDIQTNIRAWGASSLPPTGLATLALALHGRPLQRLPAFIFVPGLFFASYVNVAGYPTDSAAVTSWLSGAYTVFAAWKTRQWRWRQWRTPRGMVTVAAVGLALANVVGHGYAFHLGDRKVDEEIRDERRRWG